MDSQSKIISILAGVLKMDADEIKQFGEGDSLSAVGMDSINCVDIVLTIEEEFDVIFADEELLLDNLNTVDKLCAIVEKKMGNLVG